MDTYCPGHRAQRTGRVVYLPMGITDHYSRRLFRRRYYTLGSRHRPVNYVNERQFSKVNKTFLPPIMWVGGAVVVLVTFMLVPFMLHLLNRLRDELTSFLISLRMRNIGTS
jgi:hypothetical protein